MCSWSGSIESHFTNQHATGFYNNVCILGHYTAPEGLFSAGTSTSIKPLVYTALHTLIAAHPMLSAIAINEITNPVFVRLPFVDLDQAVRFYDGAPGDFNAYLEAQHNERFTQPFWRVVVHTLDGRGRFMVSFIFHHALGDGGTGMAFHRGFQAALPTAALSRAVSARAVPPPSPLLPALEACYDPAALTTTPPPALPADIWTGSAITAADLATRVHTLALPAATLARMVARCRAERATVTALLHAATAAAFLADVPQAYAGIRVTGAMSMRRFLPAIADDAVGCWVTGFADTQLRAPLARAGGVWDEARRVCALLQALVATGNTGAVRACATPAEKYAALLGTRRHGGAIEVSNLGLYDGGSAGGWAVADVVFSQSASVAGAAVEFSFVSTRGGGLAVGASWQECAVATATVKRGLEEMVRQIDAALA